MMVGAIVALGAFVVNEWRHDNPIVDLKLLKLRNFSTSVFMMFVLGMVLFGTTVLIPQFLQVQMGYTAEQAGKALSVGAFVLMFMMPLVGRLITRVDTAVADCGGLHCNIAGIVPHDVDLHRHRFPNSHDDVVLYQVFNCDWLPD